MVLLYNLYTCTYSSQVNEVVPSPKALPLEERAQGTISAKTYYRYFVSGGGHMVMGIVFLFFFIAEVSQVTCVLMFFIFIYSVVLLSRIGGWQIGELYTII